MPDSHQQGTPVSTTRYFLFRWAESPGNLRDAILVALGFLYALGVLTWSLSALETYIGFIQVLDAQYVVAGLIPALLINIIYLFISRARYASGRAYYRDVSPLLFLSYALLHVLDLLSPTIYVSFTGKIIHGLFSYLDRLNPAIDGLLWYVICMALTLSVREWPWKDPQIPSFCLNTTHSVANTVLYYIKCAVKWVNFLLQQSTKLAVYALPWIFLLLAIIQYVYRVFPNIPQEIGGGQPRCALLHVQKSKIANATVQALTEHHVVADNYNAAARLINEERPRSTERKELTESEQVVLTKQVRVVYHSDKSLFFQTLDLDHNVSNPQGIFEVRREAIPSIIWLGSCS